MYTQNGGSVTIFFANKQVFKALISLRTGIFIIMLIAGVVPAIILHVGILQNYEQKAV